MSESDWLELVAGCPLLTIVLDTSRRPQAEAASCYAGQADPRPVLAGHLFVLGRVGRQFPRQVVSHSVVSHLVIFHSSEACPGLSTQTH